MVATDVLRVLVVVAGGNDPLARSFRVSENDNIAIHILDVVVTAPRDYIGTVRWSIMFLDIELTTPGYLMRRPKVGTKDKPPHRGSEGKGGDRTRLA